MKLLPRRAVRVASAVREKGRCGPTLLDGSVALPVGPRTQTPRTTRARNAGEFVEYVEVNDSSLPTSNTIATKLDVPLQMTPANVGTVGPALIYEQDDRVLGDRAEEHQRHQRGRTAPACTTTSPSAGSIRWISSALIMTDGAAEPEATYYQTYNMRGRRGATRGRPAFLYGRNPLAGAVNIVRKQPLDGDFAIFNGSAGSFGTLSRGRWTGTPPPTTAASPSGSTGCGANRTATATTRTRGTLAINPSLTVNIGETSKLNFNLRVRGRRGQSRQRAAAGERCAARGVGHRRRPSHAYQSPAISPTRSRTASRSTTRTS